jgi:hypothetical protein
VLYRPPHSPDLALVDFYYFKNLKTAIIETRLEAVSSIQQTYEKTEGHTGRSFFLGIQFGVPKLAETILNDVVGLYAGASDPCCFFLGIQFGVPKLAETILNDVVGLHAGASDPCVPH